MYKNSNCIIVTTVILGEDFTTKFNLEYEHVSTVCGFLNFRMLIVNVTTFLILLVEFLANFSLHRS